jgi:hypothetical protein
MDFCHSLHRCFSHVSLYIQYSSRIYIHGILSCFTNPIPNSVPFCLLFKVFLSYTVCMESQYCGFSERRFAQFVLSFITDTLLDTLWHLILLNYYLLTFRTTTWSKRDEML